MVSDLNGHMLLQVHDQILFEIPDEMVKVAIPMIHEVMEDFPFDPRMKVDVSYGKSWGSLKKEGQEDGDSH
jgi:DNA polymerase-1